MKDSTAAAEQHPGAYHAGDAASRILTTTALGQAARALPGFSALSAAEQSALLGMISKGGMEYLAGIGPAAAGYVDPNEFANNVVTKGIGGAVGGSVAQEVSAFGNEMLQALSLENNPLAHNIVSALAGASYMAADSITTENMERQTGNEPDKATLTKEVMVSTAFVFLSSLLGNGSNDYGQYAEQYGMMQEAKAVGDAAAYTKALEEFNNAVTALTVADSSGLLPAGAGDAVELLQHIAAAEVAGSAVQMLSAPMVNKSLINTDPFVQAIIQSQQNAVPVDDVLVRAVRGELPTIETGNKLDQISVDTEKNTIYNESIDHAQFESYQAVLGELAPKSFDEFQRLKYDTPDAWAAAEEQYRILGSYKVDAGELSKSEILRLDDKVYSEKQAKFTSRYKNSGNIAGAYLDGNDQTMYYAHSGLSDSSDGYRGDSALVLLKPERRFTYTDVMTEYGELRCRTYHDSEAKLFEYLADRYEVQPFHSITMLSERGMCDSCRYVMQQFQALHPDVTINVVSNNSVEGNVWKSRRKTQ